MTQIKAGLYIITSENSNLKLSIEFTFVEPSSPQVVVPIQVGTDLYAIKF